MRRDVPVALIIPIKTLTHAKCRLALPPGERKEVARRLMTHTVSVAAAIRELNLVTVVTADPDVAAATAGLGAVVIPEPPGGGLVPAVEAARRRCRRLAPLHDIAVMVSDLPWLTQTDLRSLLAEFRATEAPMMVTDHHGTGTTALIHPYESDPPILFGRSSAQRHRAAGYIAATSPLPGLRHDLDTVKDLRADNQVLPRRRGEGPRFMGGAARLVNDASRGTQKAGNTYAHTLAQSCSLVHTPGCD